MTDTLKLKINKVYNIIGYKFVNTKFGNSCIIMDNELNKYWTTAKIQKFVAQNEFITKIVDDFYVGAKPLFTIKTGNFKKFKTEKGDEIEYLDMTIMLC